ncbi:MAG: cytochrome c [Notoacmeibacter sp.]|nr:cytochrome c [Notoacmeibacter sp.]
MSRALGYIAFSAGLTIAVTLSTMAFGHGKATGIVKERMESMVVLRDAAKALGGMMKGATPYDAEAVRAHAKSIREHSGDALTAKFPEGTGSRPSEARDEIWTEWEEFKRLAGQLESLADGLREAAGNGLMKDMSGHSMDHGDHLDPAMLAAMPADGVFMMIGKTCSACHEKFRQKMD